MLKYAFLLLLFIPAWNNLPLSAAPILPTKIGSEVGGKTIVNIRGKDLVHPTFSPDGKFLAYSEVIVQNRRENTAVHILNLETHQSFLAIDSKTAAGYGTYKSYVSSISWKQRDRLEITIADGDVDSSVLTFDPIRKKLLSTLNSEGGGISISPAARKLEQRIRTQIPQIKATDDLTQGLTETQQGESATAVVLAGTIVDRKQNIRLFDFQNRSIKPLFKAADPLAQARIESAKFSNGTFWLILVIKNEERFLAIVKRGRITSRQSLKGIKGRIEILNAANNRIWLMSYVYNTYEPGNNPLYLWDNGKLHQSTDYKQLYDARINSQGTRIAYCYWSEGKRQIVVKELASILR